MTLMTSGLAPTRHVLSTGAVILAKESRMTPAVTIEAGFRAGSLHDPDERLGLAHFCSRVIDRGTATRSADQVAEELDGRGVTLTASATRHVLSLSCTCLAEDFERVLGLIGDVVMHPAFPEAEITTKRGEIITSIR